MSETRRSSVRRLSDTLWLNDRGEKLQMVDGLLLPSYNTLSLREHLIASEWLWVWNFEKKEQKSR